MENFTIREKLALNRALDTAINELETILSYKENGISVGIHPLHYKRTEEQLELFHDLKRKFEIKYEI